MSRKFKKKPKWKIIQEQKQMIELHKQGLSPEEIAKKMKRNPAATAKAINQAYEDGYFVSHFLRQKWV